MKVFLSHAFRDEDRPLVAQVERLLASQDVKVAAGRTLAGNALTPEITARIERCDRLVAVMTRDARVGKSTTKWRARWWVESELGHARSNLKPAIALVEDGVETGGLYGDHEHIALDRLAPVEALLQLSETIQQWKYELGRMGQVQLKPDRLGHALRTRGELKCRYRFVSREGERSDWRDTPEPFTEGNGTLVSSTASETRVNTSRSRSCAATPCSGTRGQPHS